MTNRTPMREAYRVLLTVLAVAVPLVAPAALPFAAAVLGVRLAYDGPRSHGVVAVAGILLAVELVAGMDLGILTVPYLAVAVAAAGAARVLTLSPLSDADGWRLRPLVRTTLTACVLTAVITAGSVLVALLYGHGSAGQRFAVSFTPDAIRGGIAACVLLLLAFRRIDVPFRRRILFAS